MLIAVFLLVVVATLFPLEFRSIAWGFGLTNTIVNSASLALVGIGLLRYSAFLELQALTGSGAIPQTLSGTSGQQEGSGKSKSKALANQNKTELGIRRLALLAAISLLVLAGMQTVLFFRGLNAITVQSASTSSRSEQQAKEIELGLKNAPDQIIDAEWKRFQATPAPAAVTSDLVTAGKRKQLLAELNNRRKQSSATLQQQVSASRLNLARDTFKFFLMASFYAWGFYGLHKL